MKTLFLLICVFNFIAAFSQSGKIQVSGQLKDAGTKLPLAYVNIRLERRQDSSLIAGTISAEDGRFSLSDISSGNYLIVFSYTGYQSIIRPLIVGQLSNFLELGIVLLEPKPVTLNEVTVIAKQSGIGDKLDKKTFLAAENISQAGGSALDLLKNLPGITTAQDGKVQLRGSDKVMILIDGKQTALTGFGGQTGLDNIPGSSIEKIEIINQPTSKYDANGNAGIINIIYKKEKKQGFNGRVGLATGLGALWVKEENYPGIRPQYQASPKINPFLSLNYRTKKLNFFFQGDDLYTQTLNKNEFVTRYYENGDTVKQQTKRNRNTNFLTLKTGMDWYLDKHNTITVSGLFGSEKIIDRGDQPFYNNGLTEKLRLWQFLEDELKTTASFTTGLQHTFRQPGRLLNAGFNYTFHREDEKYFFTNSMPDYTGLDSFKLISDEHVADFTLDYVQPLKYGRFETGLKYRRRYIPVNMQFKPGLNSPLDTSAGGTANYSENIPAVYGNYIFENEHFEVEAGLRFEYVDVEYDVNHNHPVYKSDGYHYFQPFPNMRIGYKLNDFNKLSVGYNRRVDRPNEVDIRIFPKYDDAEIIKVGNPALQPQFTNNYELGYKASSAQGSLFTSIYHKRMDATIVRIASSVPGSNLIYSIFQNAGKSYSTGFELIVSNNPAKWMTINFSVNGYKNTIDSFSVLNKYPQENIFSAQRESIYSGNIKLNLLFHLPASVEGQLSAIYQAPDLIPQGKIYSRFSIDMGVKKAIQQGRAEMFLNVTDIANTLRVKKEIRGNGFRYISTDYYETQVFRVGYGYKFGKK